MVNIWNGWKCKNDFFITYAKEQILDSWTFFRWRGSVQACCLFALTSFSVVLLLKPQIIQIRSCCLSQALECRMHLWQEVTSGKTSKQYCSTSSNIVEPQRCCDDHWEAKILMHFYCVIGIKELWDETIVWPFSFWLYLKSSFSVPHKHHKEEKTWADWSLFVIENCHLMNVRLMPRARWEKIVTNIMIEFKFKAYLVCCIWKHFYCKLWVCLSSLVTLETPQISVIVEKLHKHMLSNINS